jgi:hypothetical protein
MIKANVLCKIGIHFWKNYIDIDHKFRYCKKCLRNQAYVTTPLPMNSLYVDHPMNINIKREIEIDKLIK